MKEQSVGAAIYGRKELNAVLQFSGDMSDLYGTSEIGGVPGSKSADAVDPNRPPSQRMVDANRAAVADPRPHRRLSATPELLLSLIKLLDCCVVLVAGVIALVLYLGLAIASAEWDRYLLISLIAATLFVVGFDRIDGYTLGRLFMLHWQLTRVAAVWAITVSALLLVAFVVKVSQTYSRGWALGWIVIALILILIERGIARLAIARWVQQGYLAWNIAIIGAGAEGERLIAKLREAPDEGIVIRGVFDDRVKARGRTARLGITGTVADLVELARTEPVNEVMIALPLVGLAYCRSRAPLSGATHRCHDLF